MPSKSIDDWRHLFSDSWNFETTQATRSKQTKPATTQSHSFRFSTTTPVPILDEEQFGYLGSLLRDVDEGSLQGRPGEQERPTTTTPPLYALQRPSEELWTPVAGPFPAAAGDDSSGNAVASATQTNEIHYPVDDFPKSVLSSAWETKKINKLLRKQSKKLVKHLMKMKANLGRGIPGAMGRDYPALATVPETEFRCWGQLPGYYADQEARCQVHVKNTDV